MKDYTFPAYTKSEFRAMLKKDFNVVIPKGLRINAVRTTGNSS